MTDSSRKRLHLQYLKVMGISVWVPRHHSSALTAASAPVNASPVVKSSESSLNAQLDSASVTMATPPPTEHHSTASDWEPLQTQVTTCTACELHKTRTQTVFGIGNLQAELMLIGEAPGADEDAQGEPFVGRAGQLLNAMLYAIGKTREDVYIANVVKCRPPDNRNPKPEELASCNNFLQRQIVLIQPKLIVALGKVAAQHLLATNTPIGKLRGQRFEHPETKIPIIATYHPAYLLRRPSEKRQSWQDLQLICREMIG